MAAVMLAGAPLCNEAYAAVNPVDLTATATKTKLTDGLKFVMQFNATGYLKTKAVEGTDYVTTDLSNTQSIDDAAVFEIRNYSAGKFELWVNGKQFVTKNAGATGVIEVFDAAAPTDITKEFVVKKSGNVVTTTDFNQIFTFKVGTAGTQLWSAVTFTPSTKGETYTADDLKEVNQSSTSFSFGADAVEGNVFQSLTPVTRPTGTIFVKGTAEDIENWEKNQDKETAAKLSIAYVKNETWGLNTSAEKNGEGYKLVMINGAEFYADKNPANWNNAVFTNIVEADKLNKEGEIDLTIKPVLGKNPAQKTVNIAAVKTSASDTKTYVTTVVSTDSKYAKVIKPTLGDNTYFAASEFLSTGKSVYNVYFTSGVQSVENGITTEFHKYLAVTSNGTDFQADALAANDVQLNSPFAQWIATGFDGKYTLTLTNRQTKQNVVLKLKTTDTAGVYEIVSTTGSTYAQLPNLTDQSETTYNEKDLAGKKIKLVKTTVTKTDGYLDLTEEEMAAKVAFKFSGKSNELGKTSFYAVPNYVATGANADSYDKLYPSQDEKKIEFYDIKKANKEVLNVTNYAYLNADNQIVTDAADTLQVPVYNISYSYFKEDAKKATVAYVKNRTLELNEATTALPSPVKENFIFPMAMNGSYTMAIASTNSAPSEYNADRWATGVVKSTTINFAADGTIKAFDPKDGDFAYVTVLLNDNNDRTSLEAASRHATFENSLGSVSMQVNKNGIIEGILAAEPATFWLDTLTNGDEVSFYISKGIKAAAEETKADEAAEVRNFMYYAKDSLYIFDEGSALASMNKNYLLEGTDADVKAIFRPATLVAHDTLTTVVDGKEKSLVKDAVKAFQYGIVLADEEVAGEYVIYSKANPSKYLYSRNGKLGFGSEKEALIVKLGEGDATANEAIAAENVAVIAGEGVVTVKGAAGKQVVVSNILGQEFANKVATSDEETFAAAVGVVVVRVDGEATKVVVK